MRREIDELQNRVDALRRTLLGNGRVQVSLADRTVSALALVVTLVALAMIFASLFAFGVDSTIKFSSILTGIVGLVLGFYLGKHGLSRAQEGLAWAQRDAEEARVTVSRTAAERDAMAAENRILLQYKDLATSAEDIIAAHKRTVEFIRDQDMEEEFRHVRVGGDEVRLDIDEQKQSAEGLLRKLKALRRKEADQPI